MKTIKLLNKDAHRLLIMLKNHTNLYGSDWSKDLYKVIKLQLDSQGVMYTNRPKNKDY